jgi:hypothetical protein
MRKESMMKIGENIVKTYFIIDDEAGLVKIGRTSGDPNRRLKELQTGNGHLLRLALCLTVGDEDPINRTRLSGYNWDEFELHRRFRKSHVRGKWFRLHGPTVKYPYRVYTVAEFLAAVAEDGV